MIPVFTITLLVSSSLLFLVQPMFARMVLPLLGGTPAVWNTCMVFFQATLLAGYLYAHLTTRFLGVRRQALLHAALLLAPLLILPIGIGQQWTPPTETNPIGWLLLLLAVTLGLPFFIVAASAPLMQKWFSSLGHRHSDDPYFLYAASNAGSMVALLAYPTLAEPLLTLSQQSAVWTGGYVAFALLTIGCAALVLRFHKRVSNSSRSLSPAEVPARDAERLAWSRRLRWVALAAVPSSLLLGVTEYISTDLVVVPALWVIPLALYLLTFILVFARKRLIPQVIARRMLPIAAVVLVIMLLIEATQPLGLIVAGHLIGFFVLALACHGELADDRPSTDHLTSFYLMLGVGGMLGGMFNALLAPNVFTSLAEYPIAIAASALLMLRLRELRGRSWIQPADIAQPVLIAVVAVVLVMLANATMFEVTPLRMLLTAGIPALGCYLLSHRPLRFALAIGMVFVAGSLNTINRGHVLESHRGFFGVHRVTRHGEFIQLYHGTTLHGSQRIDPKNGLPVAGDAPLAYYHPDGPVGQVFQAFQQAGRCDTVGLVGLGVGALAAYGQAGQTFAYFEIDPLVRDIAENQQYFTYLADARQRDVDVPIVLGDARLTLQRVEPGTFDVLVIDAFSSDSIPVHLLTREALEVYWRAVAEQGVVVMHISNRYLNLEPVLANLAADMNLICLIRDDSHVAADQTRTTGREGSVWALLGRDAADLQPITSTPGRAMWFNARRNGSSAVWTDEYSNVLGAIRWRD